MPPIVSGTPWSVRKVLGAMLVLLLAGGLMSNLPAAIASPTAAGPPVVRIGTVLATPLPSAAYVAVRFEVGGPTHVLPYQVPYVPFAGDQVTVLWFAASGSTMAGIVLGGRSGQSGNRVLNGDFMVVNPAAGLGVPPPTWTHYRASGAAGSTVTGALFTGHETPVMSMAITSAAASDNYAYSAAIPVTPGESYRLDAVGNILAVSPSLTLELRALWFADDQTLYPGTVAADSLGDSVITGAGGVDYGLGNDNVVVPAGARFMRAAIRVIHDAGAGGNYTVHVWSVQAYKV